MSDMEDLRYELRVPTFCPVCTYIMKGSISNHTYYNFGCCSNCHIGFVEGREERWGKGWRPSLDELEKYYDKL